MTRLVRRARLSFAGCLLGCLALAYGHFDSTVKTPPGDSIAAMAQVNELIRRQPGYFVPNLGQWEHQAKFVHRSGPMTLFLEHRGWVVDLVERSAEPESRLRELGPAGMPGERQAKRKTRGLALRMTFEGDGHVPRIVGEQKLVGRHNYFLGRDEGHWRTGVPLYASVRYEHLYPGIDLRLREANGRPEYDLLLQPGADLAAVTVRVEGAQGLSIANDGSLIIATVLGPLTQSVPKTWQECGVGRKCEVACNFTLLGADRFGFEVSGWDGDTRLTIDPGLIWSTYLGGGGLDFASALSVDANGVATVAGWAGFADFPTSSGSYDTTYNGIADAFVSRLDPSKSGVAQLVFSTFLGGSGADNATALSVDASGLITVAGSTYSNDFPTTGGAYDTTHDVNYIDCFVARLDPSRSGAAQLVYSTFLGGSREDHATALSVDAGGVATVAGWAASTDFPTTSGAYDTTHNGPIIKADAFVSRLDPSKAGTAQLVYSTFLGGSGREAVRALSVSGGGVVTVAGWTDSSDYPTTSGAYQRVLGTFGDAFVSRLDPRKTGSAQLVYSTYVGGRQNDSGSALSVDAGGVVTMAGSTLSIDFPTTSGAYDTTYNGGGDTFVSRLDPSRTGTAQLVYSTFLADCAPNAMSVDTSGVVTVAGLAFSARFPTTRGAYDTTYNSSRRYNDAFVCRLDPSRSGTAQLVYSTFLGGTGVDNVNALGVDASGVVTVAGTTGSFSLTNDFPTTKGAFDTSYNGGLYASDAFVSRLDMGVALYGDVHEISIKAGGTQRLVVNAGQAHARQLYWIFGSITGTTPGVNLLGVHIPLNPDSYTDVAIANVNTTVFTTFKGSLDSNGRAAASFNVPANLPVSPGYTFYHAYVVYDARGKFYMASNAVPLQLK